MKNFWEKSFLVTYLGISSMKKEDSAKNAEEAIPSPSAQ